MVFFCGTCFYATGMWASLSSKRGQPTGWRLWSQRIFWCGDYFPTSQWDHEFWKGLPPICHDHCSESWPPRRSVRARLHFTQVLSFLHTSMAKVIDAWWKRGLRGLARTVRSVGKVGREILIFIKGSWEAIFRVTDDFYSMKGGVWLCITSQWEVWDYLQWRVVCDFTSHNNEKCETIFNEGWCVTLQNITMRSVRLYSMSVVWFTKT